MTTDTVPKAASRRVDVGGVPVTVTGIAKGAGMIHPDMATMLSFMATDAPIAAAVLTQIAREVADVSFNGATIDGDTSTNDSFVIAATGKAPLAPITIAGRFAPRAHPRGDRGGRNHAGAGHRARRRRRHQVHFDSRRGRRSRSPNASASRSASPTRRWSRPRSSPPIPTSGRIVCAIGNTASPDTDPGANFVLARRRAGRRPRRPRGDLPRGRRPARDEAGRDRASASTWVAARRQPRSGPATSRTTTCPSTPTTDPDGVSPH